jgi:hypothetical protein
MPQFYLHLLPLASRSSAVKLSFIVDYAVAAGVDDGGKLVLPSCPDIDYLIPAGVPGLPYVADLGTAGAENEFTFPVPVVAVVVVTMAAAQPVVQLSATSSEPRVLASSTLSRRFLPDNSAEWVYNIIWSNPEVQSPANLAKAQGADGNPAPPPPAGKTLAQLTALGYHYPEPINEM